MRRLIPVLVVVLAACGDAGEANNGQTSDNASNATSQNVNTNVSANNTTANNLTTGNNTTVGPRCDYFEGDFVAESDADVAPLIDVGCARVEGDLVLSGAVSDITGIDVTEVGGNLRISATRLRDVPFERLEQVDGSVIIERNPALSQIEGFQNLSDIGGNLVISEGPISNVTGFSSLRRVDGLLLNDLPFAFDFSGLSGLNTVRTFAVYDVPALESLDDFERVVTARTLQLYRNDALASADGVRSSTFSRVEVALNPVLSTLPLNYSETDPVEVLVSQNDVLATVDIDGATRLRRVWAIANDTMSVVRIGSATTMSEEFRIERQPTTSIEVPQLETFEEVYFEELPVTGLPDVGFVSGSALVLQNLEQLVTLDGLEGLDQVRGTFSIISNSELTSIEALQGMSRVGTFRVRANPSLPSCQVDAVAMSIGTISNLYDEGANDTSAVCP